MDEPTLGGWARLSNVRIGAVVAVAVAVAFIVWLLVRGDDKAATTNGTTSLTSTSGASVGPAAATPARLRALSVQEAHPVYWAGPKPNTTYELTRTSNGRIFVRYLPRGVPVGIRKATYAIVGTYPVPNAMKVLQDLAKKPGETSLAAPVGGFAVYDTAQPTNVYLAYPGSNLQIEVFDPSPQRALRLITTGLIAPIR